MNLIKTFYLTRHGSTVYNEMDRLQGISDIPLSEKGILESKLLAERLKTEKFDMIFHSPLIRSKQTAEIVNQFHQLPLVCVDEFIEMNMGEWEGQNFPQFIEKNAEFYMRWITDPSVGMPGGESFSNLFERVKNGVERVLTHCRGNILIVTHALVTRAILGSLMDFPIPQARQFRTGNCSLSKVMIYDSPFGPHKMIDMWNDMSHITQKPSS